MSVRGPRRSNADGLSENVLKAILQSKEEQKKSEVEQNEGRGTCEETSTITDQERSLSSVISQQQLVRGVSGAGGNFLDTTSLSTSSKRSLHSSRLTLSDSKEFYKTYGCRWIRAVRLGDAKMVKKMLEEKPELVHYAPMYGPLALHIATARSDKQMIRYLVTRGADVDARDGAGYTSLQLAIRRGDQSLAHFLISQGANRNILDPDGLHINDYDEWDEYDQWASEKHVSGKTGLRPKSHSFIGSPSSASVKSSNSIRPTRPSSTPDSSLCYEKDGSDLKRDSKRTSWRAAIFAITPFGKRSSSSSKA